MEYTGTDDCCKESDPCGLARNGACDCVGDCSWDTADCAAVGEAELRAEIFGLPAGEGGPRSGRVERAMSPNPVVSGRPRRRRRSGSARASSTTAAFTWETPTE